MTRSKALARALALALDAADAQLDLETLAARLASCPVPEAEGRMPWRERLRIMAREVGALADLLAEAGREGKKRGPAEPAKECEA